MRGHFARRSRSILAIILASAAFTSPLYAAGPYAVGTSEVDPAGTCYADSWASFAQNGDFVGITNPACVFNFGHPLDLGIEFKRAESDGDWTSQLKIKAKANIIPIARYGLGFGINGNVNFDLLTHEARSAALFFPISLQLAEPLRLHLKIGMQWDLIRNRSFETWGANLELKVAPKMKVLAEVYGQDDDRPSAQAGLRYSPHEKIDFEFVYGRNIEGEQSNWFTFGVNMRF